MKRLLLLIVFASVALAQTPAPPSDSDQAIASTVNFLGSITGGVTELVSVVAPSIMPLGWTILAVFGAYALLQVLLQSTMRQLSAHHYQPLAAVVAYVAILFRIVVAATMLSFYLINIPGLPFNFHNMFPYFAQGLASTVTSDLMKQTIAKFNDALHFLPTSGMFEVLPAIVHVLVVGTIALAEIGMTVITASSYVIVGFLVLVGPLMIPFYVLPGHDKKFWTWFDNLLSYSMYVFTGSCFVFVFCHAYLDFFTNLHGYSVGQWLTSLMYLNLITIPFVWTMFKVPEVTHMVWGGMSGLASGFAGTLQSLVVRGITAGFL